TPLSTVIPGGAVVPATISGLKAAATPGWGGKAMLGYRFNNNWDVGVGGSGGWLTGKKKSNNYVVDTDFTIPISDGIDVTLDGTVTQSLKVKLNYQVADFEAGYNFTMGSGSNLRVFGGLRYARFNQTAQSKITAAGSIVVDGGGIDVDTSGTAVLDSKRKSTFAGIGPRLGINGSFGLGAGGFNVFGGLSGALLYGKFKDKRSFHLHATGATPAATIDTATSVKDKSKNKLVPNLEGELGIGYNFNAGGATTVGLQLGYRAEKWWGVSSDAPIFGFGGITGPTSHRSDQLMHGPFLRLTATFGSAAPAPMAPPPPVVSPVNNKAFIVFFDFDRSNITAPAQTIINDAIAAAKAGGSTRVTLTGHTDRSGSEQYNQALSVRRGEAVKAAMIRGGIPANAIVVIGRGESAPLVPTADGVRE